MTFTKPANTTYTQMAQWIDSLTMTSFSEQEEAQLCQYLYHLVLFRAQQLGLFTDYEQLDDFSIFAMSRLYTRVKDTDNNIKSISNYIKNIVPLWRADYIREFCCGSADIELANFNVFDFSDYLIDVSSLNDFESYHFNCFEIVDVVRKYLKRVPRKLNSAEWTNIYISCLLTLQDRLITASTLLRSDLDLKDPQLLDKLLRSLRAHTPILFHLDETMQNYIKTLVNEITHALAAQITHVTCSKVSASACLRNMVIAAANETKEN